MENRYFIEKTTPNHDFITFSLSIVKYLDLENFRSAPQNCLSSLLFTMKIEKNASKSGLDMFFL